MINQQTQPMIERLTDAVVAVIGLEGRLAESVSFFLYDSIKIIFLLWILDIMVETKLLKNYNHIFLNQHS